jgi:PGF-CTERM protein
VERKVFSSPRWDADHGAITVSNTGDAPITVHSWVGDQSNNTSIPIKANETATVLTPAILAEANQIVDMGFEAYQNDTLIDSYRASLYMNPTPTPAPTKTQSPGFAVAIALAGLLAAGYLITRKED